VAPKFKFNLRLYFIFCVFGILSTTILFSGLITLALNQFVSSSVSIPTFVWVLIFDVVLGTSITTFLSNWVLSPITRLSNAMKYVAAGDFNVALQSNSKIREVQDTYLNFNMMVRELKATEMLQSDFVSNISHEFKTPINAIEGYATLLQDRPQPPEEQQEYIEKILFNTRRLSELVSNILLLSKVENQAIQVEKKDYRLDEQIRQAILALEQKWTKKEIEFDVDMEQVLYCGNENLMLHVWTNLIDNAVKFDPCGGIVRIRLKTCRDHVEFEIEDNGPGVSETAQKHIYDKFFQADSSRKTEGSGLGLALVKRILDICNGNIRIQSGQDCGSRFVVSLPTSNKS
jgi:two-component system sensor histidine kinase BaeS